ncbi:MAG: hypothetical protein R3B41_02135 [Candidatus Doudnabacteria bacterium]
MNNKIIGIVIAIIILGGGAYLLSQKQSTQVASEQDTADQASSINPEDTSLKQLLSLNKNQKCTISSNKEDEPMTGEVYFTKDKYRADVDNIVDGQTYKGHIVFNAETNKVSVWSDNETMGFTMSVDEQTSAQDNPENNPEPINSDTSVKVDCESWDPDSTMFDLPNNIEFQDFDQMMQAMDLPANLDQANAPDTQIDTNICEKLPADQQESCKKALSGN